MIKAEIIADSMNEFGNRITTFVVTFPRIILAEFNTHRMFSRNSASSRAIPFERMLKMVQENPFVPNKWMLDHKGMQGSKYLTEQSQIDLRKGEWLKARDSAVNHATSLSGNISSFNGNHSEEVPNTGITKQLCNRLLEPFMWHTVIVTATEWENFFALRCPSYEYSAHVDGELIKEKFRSKRDYKIAFYNRHPKGRPILFASTPGNPMTDVLAYLEDNNDPYWYEINKGQAEIHMMALAEAMWDAYNISAPKHLKPGQWHVPFGDQLDQHEMAKVLVKQVDSVKEGKSVDDLLADASIKIATARCARVSYMNFDGSNDYNKDIELYDRLAASGHWSPFEHCARAMTEKEYEKKYVKSWDDYNTRNQNESAVSVQFGWCGNFRGFIQYRKMFENENQTDSRVTKIY